jgi:hypothetical protein
MCTLGVVNRRLRHDDIWGLLTPHSNTHQETAKDEKTDDVDCMRVTRYCLKEGTDDHDGEFYTVCMMK